MESGTAFKARCLPHVMPNYPYNGQSTCRCICTLWATASLFCCSCPIKIRLLQAIQHQKLSVSEQWQQTEQALTDWNRTFKCWRSVAYLECVKGGGPRGLGDGSPPVGSRGKALVGGLGDAPEADAFFCYWMPKLWCFRRKKLVKQPKNTIIKNYGRLKGGAQAQAPPLNTPLLKVTNQANLHQW